MGSITREIHRVEIGALRFGALRFIKSMEFKQIRTTLPNTFVASGEL